MKKLFATILMIVSISASAGAAWAGNDSDTVRAAGFAKLSEAEKAEVIKIVAEKASTRDLPITISEDKVEKWVNIGTNIGKGLAGAAKEVGVAVNDFSLTPVGQLTMALIVWHILGAQLVHVLGGILIWIVGFTMIRHILNRAYPNEVIYDEEKKNIFGNAAIKKINRTPMADDNAAGWLVAHATVLIAGLIAIFTF